MSADTHADYARLKGVNWSSLKNLEKSALEYQYRLAHPIEQTPAMALGVAAHMAVFEPERFDETYVIWDGGPRTTKEWKAFRAEHEGREILTAGERALCIGMRDSVRSHSVAAALLRQGEAEQTIQWTDPETGLPCKARMDWLDVRSAALTELKSTNTIDSFPFGRLANRMGYPKQLAHYRNGARIVYGLAHLRVVIIAVEQKPPHDVAVFEVTGDHLDAAAETVAGLLTKLKYHIDTDTWPGRYPEEQILDIDGYEGEPTITFDEEEVP